METVNNLASAASRAIWGDSTETKKNETAGTEPISGETGNVKAGEPYDKGNLDDESVKTENNANQAGLPTFLNYQKDGPQHSTPTAIGNTDATNLPSTSTGNTDTISTNPSTTGATSSNLASTSTDNTSSTPNTTALPSTEDKTLPNTTSKEPSTVDPSSTTTPSTSTTSKMTDNTPPTTLTKPSGTTDISSSTNGPPSESQPATKPHPDTGKGEKETEQSKISADLAAKGIEETKGTGDHAPKFDTFKTSGGPHIEHEESDGRVGPDVPKGDLKDFDEREENTGEASSATGVHSEHTPSSQHTHDTTSSSKDDVSKQTSATSSGDHEGKEKLSFKDKIKAKLHHNKN